MDEPTYDKKNDFITFDSVDSLVLDRDPSFLEYLFYHNVLDRLCWTLKLHYADRETVKRKRYRIETLFQWSLLENKANKSKALKSLPTTFDEDKIEFHLTKGWHNELVRSDPLHPDYLQVGTKLSGWSGPGSGGMVAWNIIQSYYAVFEYLSCVTVSTDQTLVIDGHRKLANEFTNHVLGKVRDRMVFYPFTITSDSSPKKLSQTGSKVASWAQSYRIHHASMPGCPRCGNRACRPPAILRGRASRRIRSEIISKHTEYFYATYPRIPGVTVNELEYQVQKALIVVGEGKRTSFLDLLYQLRLWANYTGVSSLLKLSDGGYQGFLMKNLALITFFVGGMAELAVIFGLGESRYLGMLHTFSIHYINKSERFARSKYLIPMYIRLRVYRHLGLVSGKADFIIPESADPVRFVELPPSRRADPSAQRT